MVVDMEEAEQEASVAVLQAEEASEQEVSNCGRRTLQQRLQRSAKPTKCHSRWTFPTEAARMGLRTEEEDLRDEWGFWAYQRADRSSPG